MGAGIGRATGVGAAAAATGGAAGAETGRGGGTAGAADGGAGTSEVDPGLRLLWRAVYLELKVSITILPIAFRVVNTPIPWCAWAS